MSSPNVCRFLKYTAFENLMMAQRKREALKIVRRLSYTDLDLQLGAPVCPASENVQVEPLAKSVSK